MKIDGTWWWYDDFLQSHTKYHMYIYRCRWANKKKLIIFRIIPHMRTVRKVWANVWYNLWRSYLQKPFMMDQACRFHSVLSAITASTKSAILYINRQRTANYKQHKCKVSLITKRKMFIQGCQMFLSTEKLIWKLAQVCYLHHSRARVNQRKKEQIRYFQKIQSIYLFCSMNRCCC